MTPDWLLVETLGNEPAVVAHGRQTKNLVPISAFLRRNPHLMAIHAAVAETVRTGEGLSTITPKNDRVIRTEAVRMSDGHVHGVHVWTGPLGEEPPERPIPGPLKWDLTLGIATDTRESLANSGMDPEKEATHGRAFAEDLPTRDLNPSETRVLSLAIRSKAGETFCSTWDVTDHQGNLITVGFVARANMETFDDGSERLIARAMNWRAHRDGPPIPADHLAQRILNGLAQPGVCRALVDLNNWTLLKWLDEPCPYYDWRTTVVHPDDVRHMASMTTEFADGATIRILRLRGGDGGWVPLHVTVNRVELEEDTYAGLITLRLPTETELVGAGLLEPADPPPAKRARKSKPRRKDRAVKPAS
ncbi:MAG: hypothetical protein JWR37_5181 [Mycobacterium sp.]|jgi:hypothetical protein|nr:hypothetical protein [Mycobacterium sp.]